MASRAEMDNDELKKALKLFTHEELAQLQLRSKNELQVIAVMGGAWGDEGKGKLVDLLTQLAKTLGIVLVVRWCGTHNAGHTIHVVQPDGTTKKIVTHLIPSGVIRGIPSLIGPNCILDPEKFEKELRELEAFGIPNVRELVKVSSAVHIITASHKKEEAMYEAGPNPSIGTTKSGSGPCRGRKANRVGALWVQKCLTDSNGAQTIFAEGYDPKTDGPLPPTLSNYFRDGKICGCEIVDSYDYIKKIGRGVVIAEGAQGHNLSINSRDFPYVTSDDVTVGSLTSVGLPVTALEYSVVVFKMYDTYLGSNPNYYGNDLTSFDRAVFDRIVIAGGERGATTGRIRLPNWFNLDRALEAIDVNQGRNSVKVVINKCDVLEQVGNEFWMFKVRHNGKLVQFDSYGEMEQYVDRTLRSLPCVSNVIFSRSPSAL